MPVMKSMMILMHKTQKVRMRRTQVMNKGMTLMRRVTSTMIIQMIHQHGMSLTTLAQ